MNEKKYSTANLPSEEVLDRLLDGVRDFNTREFIPNQQFFQELKEQQSPHTLFIGCSDSRVVPHMLTQSFAGELFVVRNIGNLVPLYGKDSDTFAATSAVIEYAVKQLRVKSIVVCGHSNCGGCAALYYKEEEMKKLPHTKMWLELAKPVKEIVEEKIAKGKLTLEMRAPYTEKNECCTANPPPHEVSLHPTTCT